MRWLLTLVVGLAVGAGLTGQMGAAEEPAKKEAAARAKADEPQKGFASAVLMITGLPRQTETTATPDSGLERLMWISARPGEFADSQIEFMPLFRFDEETPVTGLLQIRGKEAEKTLQVAKKRLGEALQAIYEARIMPMEIRVREAQDQLERVRRKAESLREAMGVLRSKILAADASPEGLDSQISRLKQESLKLRVALAGLSARREAIGEHISKAAKRAEEASKGQNDALAELEKVAKLREHRLATLAAMHRSGTVPQSEMQQAEVELAQARVAVAEHRRQLDQWAAKEQLSGLTQQLADVQSEIADHEARVRVIDAALGKLESKEVQGLIDQYQGLSRELEDVQAEGKAMSEEVARLMRAREAVARPSVQEIRPQAAAK